MATPRFAGRVGVNVAYKLASEVLGKLLTLLLIGFVARGLGQAGFGIYVLGFTLGLILAQVSDFGTQVFVAREVASNRPDIARLVGNLLLARGAFGLLALACLSIWCLSSGFGPVDRAAICLLAAGGLVNSLGEFFFYVFRGRQDVRFEAILSLAQRLLGLILGLTAIGLGWGVVGVVAGIFAASCISTLAGYRILLVRFFRPEFRMDTGLVLSALRDILPIGLAICLSAICFRVDVVLLQGLKGVREVGLYGVGRRLMEPWSLLPAALMAGVFPAFAGLPADDPRRSALSRNTLALLLGLGAVIAAAAIAFRRQIIWLVFGPAYADSAFSFAILMTALVPMFITYGLTHFLIALGLARFNAAFTGAALILNVGLNLALIPSMGAAGSAISLLATEGMLMVLCAGALIHWNRKIDRNCGSAR